MALSTIIPSATISPVTDIWWMGNPVKNMHDSAYSIVSGNDSATMNADRQPKVNSKITKIKKKPSAILPNSSFKRAVV